MRFSKLDEIRSSRSMTDRFGGYNHNVRIGDNEFYDTKNLTTSHYPVLSPRGKRGIHAYATQGTHSCNGMIEKDALCYVDGTVLYINGTAVSGFTVTDSPKQLISMGAYIIVMPDKKYINTKDLTDYGSIDASYTSVSTVYYELCKADGTVYTDITVSVTAPANPSDGDLWIDTSATPHTLKQYSSASSMWVGIPTTYVRIRTPGIAEHFKKYDGVTISGMVPAQMADLEGKTSVLFDSYRDEAGSGAGDYIVVVGIIDTISQQSQSITVSRQMPEVDFVIESENRLWGCRYGTANNGDTVNEIYASKLGDFKNWNCFMGLSTDSYVASCGTDGPFTGAYTHLGYPLFFKENCMHKVYGNFPANYQIQTIQCRGVMKGCGRSFAVVDEKLFYKSRNGICYYDGSLPVEVSQAFGDIRYTGLDSASGDLLRNGAVAGSHQSKYYISMKSELDSKWYLFVYDAYKNIWMKEDELRVDHFCSVAGELYYVDHKDRLIHTVMGSGTLESDPVQWMAETGILGTDSPDKKYISQLMVRMALNIESRVMFYIQYDSMGDWEHIATVVGTVTRTFDLPIKPKRCDHFRLRIEGMGEAKIYSIARTIENGGD